MKTEYWEALKRPPPEALKSITGGRLRGKTEINPQWRLGAMTAEFGAVGVGWKYTVDKLWLEPAAEDEVCAFLAVSVSIKVDGEWSAPIPGIGGSKIVEKEKSGPYTNDQCYKMALTDALGVAMRALGVGADIYRNRWDGAKYRDEPGNSKPEPTTDEELADPIYLNELKKAWLMWQFDTGSADNSTPRDILAKRFVDFLPQPATQAQVEAAWERLAEAKATPSDPGEITAHEERKLFYDVARSDFAAANDITAINAAETKLNNEYTSDEHARAIFNMSEARREEIRDGRGESSTQESEG